MSIDFWKVVVNIQAYQDSQPLICPNRINLPSPRSHWYKIELEERKISATGGVARADLFYWDCLLEIPKDTLVGENGSLFSL